MIIRIVTALILLIASNSFGAFINLPRDSNGWTTFTPSDDSRILYVSSSGNDGTGAIYDDDDAAVGVDPFNPSGTINAHATFAAAYAKTRDGYPDWILIKRGDTFYQNVGEIDRNGRGATEPFLIGSYGSTGASPIFKSSTSGFAISYKSYIAISGIDFYAHSRNPADGEYTNIAGGVGISVLGSPGLRMNGILIEGCKIRFFSDNMINGFDNADGITIRRSIITDTYSQNTDSAQGLFFAAIDGDSIIEENIFDHNGWYAVAGGSPGEATVFNQNIYLSTAANVIVRDNISARAANICIKSANYENITVNSLVIDNNLLIDCAVGISIWGEATTAALYTYVGVTDNVMTDPGKTGPADQDIAWGMEFADFNSGLIQNNLMINQSLSTVYGYGIMAKGVFEDITISDNIFYNMTNVTGLTFFGDTDNPNYAYRVAYSNNIVQLDRIVEAQYDPSGRWTFSGNKYYSTLSDGEHFNLLGTDITDAYWATAAGDNSTFEQVSFPAPTRSIETYMTSLGETGTLDAFYIKARAQDRYNWDTRFTADTVSTWIRAGFIAAEEEPPPVVNVIATGTQFSGCSIN